MKSSRFASCIVAVTFALALAAIASRWAQAETPAKPADGPTSPANLAYVGNGAKPATATSVLPEGKHSAAGLNDGKYGNDSSWIPKSPMSSFTIELAKPAEIGRFRLGRDRLHAHGDRRLVYLKIETSLDGQKWQTALENKKVNSIPSYDPAETLEIQIAPVQASQVKVTVDPVDACLDEFEIYSPATAAAKKLPNYRMLVGASSREITIEKRFLNLPVKNGARMQRMTLAVDGKNVRAFDIEFPKDQPDFWAFVDVGVWKGKKLTVTAGAFALDESPLDQITQSDEITDAKDVYAEKLRPQFHYSQKRGWNNDPNGMVYNDGEWNLFYQHNPYGWNWGNMHWGHAVSKDLLHWEELPDALYPFTMAKDHCYSGSAVVDTENTSGFQTGKEKVMVAMFTDTGAGESLAYSNDRGRTWTYWEGNPAVRHGGRDPKVFWYAPGKHWVLVVYDTAGGNNIAIYNSTDLKKWTLESHLPGFYECPEMFELPVDGAKDKTRWVATAADGKYLIGQFDGKKFIPDQPEKQTVHHGAFYASQTFTQAPDGRRIQIGWARIPMWGMPFNQTFTFPLELTLHTTPEGIRMWAKPIAEISKLSKAEHVEKDTAIGKDKGLEVKVGSHLLDVRAEFEVGTAKTFGLMVLGERFAYDSVHGALCGVPMKPVDGKVRIQILVDRSIKEICGNDGQIYITGAFQDNPKADSVGAWCDSGEVKVNKLEIHELNSIWK